MDVNPGGSPRVRVAVIDTVCSRELSGVFVAVAPLCFA
jgi:hypothetical protein